MFTFLNRPQNTECVYNLIEQTVDERSRGPPIYRSKYSCMVRNQAYCNKTGCYKTMGVPKACLCPPQNYLKKNSRAPITIKPPAVPRIKLCNPPPCPDPCESQEGNNDCGQETQEESCEQQQPPCGPVCCVPKCRVPRICCNIMKPCVPNRCVGFEIIPRGCKNYIHSNVVKALRMPAKKPALRFVDHPKGHTQTWCDSGYPRKYVYKDEFGCVPAYVENIKEELRQDDLQAKYDMKFKERDIQQQIRPLDPTEHQALICGLKKNWEEKFAEYQSFSLLLDNVGKVKRKQAVEDELKRLEKDIQLLERHDHIFVSETCRSFYLA
ncbi:Enkurin [Orchesella cincta]|uniref:Enkurin n=1 Tax=Orchesella cincta TaxID=48709 RepID=A0A1D2NMV1_ORCCI|nr:Enkurin [Orchesella cincta]